MRLAFLAAILLTATACTRTNSTSSVTLPSEIVVSKPAFATQRFIPTNSAHLAFDTKTGSLCKTWGWGDYSADKELASLPIARQTSTCDRLYTYDIEEQAREEQNKIAKR